MTSHQWEVSYRLNIFNPFLVPPTVHKSVENQAVAQPNRSRRQQGRLAFQVEHWNRPR
jgi:hypothetical protein